MGKLEGKVAVVTGGTAGIGIGITQVFLEEGAQVVFCGRREKRGREIEAGYRADGYDATFVRCDMTVEQDVQNLLDRAVNTYGKVDILVNNAGVMHPFPITDMDMAKDYDAVMNVNIRAYFLATKLFSNAIGEGGDCQHRVGRRPRGGAHAVHLRCIQSGNHLAHQEQRRRARAQGHPRERHLPGHHLLRDDAA